MGYDQIGTGGPLGEVDSDHDGLTDSFERLAGTDPYSTDSDHDGLSDGFDAVTRSHSNPLAADTDHDGLPDSVEYVLGTDPTQIDTDHDGLSDGIESQLGTDPLHSDLGTGLGGPLDGQGVALDADPAADPAHGTGLDAAAH